MSDNAKSQLENILSELEAKEAELSQQLEDVSKQKEALRQVIGMFGESNIDTLPASTPASKSKKDNSKPADTPKKTTSKKKTVAKKKSSQKKKDGRTADWQKYALPGVKDQPMPESVKLVLSTQPDKDFKIAEVMSSLFKENMPKSQYLKDGEWHKGNRGAYRLNPT